MKSIAIILFLIFTLAAGAQTKTQQRIIEVLQMQQIAWNKGDLNGYMQGYAKSDSLQFVGSRGITYGWDNTLDNYQKGYPDRGAMGTLSFDILEVRRLSPKYYYVTGKWFLSRTNSVGGHFTLLFQKIRGEWKIVADHSS